MNTFYSPKKIDENTLKEHVIGAFNAKNGRLRISITPACQLKCKFCHMEGNKNHWAKEYMSLDFFRNLISEFQEIGGREINITGGEPLLHPNFSEILDAASNFNQVVTLSTNGLLLDRLLKTGNRPKIDLVKVSVHSTDTNSGRKYLGRAWNYERVKDNILNLKSEGYSIILNFTQGTMNWNETKKVIDLAVLLGVDLKIIDVGWTEANAGFYQEHYCAVREVREHLQTICSSSYDESDFIGANISVFKVDDIKVLLRDTENGRLHTDMCKGCQLKSQCSEGVFALRVNASGIFKPCLLRDEFDVCTNGIPKNEAPTKLEVRRLLENSIGHMWLGSIPDSHRLGWSHDQTTEAPQ